MTLFEQLYVVSKYLRTKDLTFQQLVLLSTVRAEEPISMTRISEVLGHSTAASTGIVDACEKRQLVCRQHDPVDRRRVSVIMTPKGFSTLTGVEDHFQAEEARRRKEDELRGRLPMSSYRIPEPLAVTSKEPPAPY